MGVISHSDSLSELLMQTNEQGLNLISSTSLSIRILSLSMDISLLVCTLKRTAKIIRIQ